MSESSRSSSTPPCPQDLVTGPLDEQTELAIQIYGIAQANAEARGHTVESLNALRQRIRTLVREARAEERIFTDEDGVLYRFTSFADPQ